MPHAVSWEVLFTSSAAAASHHHNYLSSSHLDGDVSPTDVGNVHIAGKCSCVLEDNSDLGQFRRRQSQQATSVKSDMDFNITSAARRSRSSTSSDVSRFDDKQFEQLRTHLTKTLIRAPATSAPAPRSEASSEASCDAPDLPAPAHHRGGSLAAAMQGSLQGGSIALNDTPTSTAPNSPLISASTSSDGPPPVTLSAPALRPRSGSATPRIRPTTLDIPGLTKSKVSPDGRISQRDVGSKLVIVMVGLPARGKSYITKKLARYLNWLQHDTRIFNVGERRRTVAGGPHTSEKVLSSTSRTPASAVPPPPATEAAKDAPTPTKILLNGEEQLEAPSAADLASHKVDSFLDAKEALASKILAQDAPAAEEENMEHNSGFFDPSNQRASRIREQVARETLDELLDYILVQGGSVGILDATNSTMERRKMVMDRIRERAGPQLNVLFLESRCVDKELLEANMRLKLNGPDYRNKDPAKALEDFRKRVQEYEKAYVPLGQYEEDNDMPYIQMIDVGRKVISHQIKGFLMAQANYYLLNFNLTPRQIWITRHGLSMDNVSGKIGGDSELAAEGVEYAKALTRFMDERRREWDMKQQISQENTHFPPLPGDSTPPNPHYHPHAQDVNGRDIPDTASLEVFNQKAFCVWTSMLKRSIDTAQFFDEEDYDIKQMRMLDELNAGVMEGLTYSCISKQYPDEYVARKADKLHYRYPGPGGEGYLDIINRLRPVIVELERMTDHVLLIGHRSVARVLLAYFLGLGREVVADLDVPIGMLYCLEPKPYGVDFKAYQWQPAQQWFTEVPDFKLKRAAHDMQ